MMTAYDIAGLVMVGRPDPREKVFTLCELVAAYRDLNHWRDELQSEMRYSRDTSSKSKDPVIVRCRDAVATARLAVDLLESTLGVQ